MTPAPKACELILIAALARDRVIGKDNHLLWHLPEDMKHFKSLTQGHAVIMGRKTWESLPAKFRPLPGRKNIVISRNPHYAAAGALVATSLEEACRISARVGAGETVPAITFVIGGAEIYALALPLADRMELTEIDASFDGDAWFPPWPESEWVVTQREPRRHEHPDGHPAGSFDYAFVSYRRKNPQPATQST